MGSNGDVLLVSGPRKTMGAGEEVGENLGLGYLAAVMRKQGVSVEILDAGLEGLSVAGLIAAIRARSFRVLGFSVVVPGMLRPTLSTLTALGATGRSGRDYLTVMGGHVPTFSCRSILRDVPALDVVVCGEGEETFPDLVARVLGGRSWHDCSGLAYRLDGQVVVTTPRPLVTDLDCVPHPARDKLALSLQRGTMARLISSRGCHGGCAFCSIRAFYGGSPGPVWRGRHPEDVAAEVDELVGGWGIRHFRFSDDNFVGPGRAGRQRALAVADAIASLGRDLEFTIACRPDDVDHELFAGLKAAGLRTVFLGVESGNQHILDALDKGITVERSRQAVRTLRALGLRPGLGFIMFTPYTRLEDLPTNFEFLRELGIGLRTRGDMLNILNRLEVYEGTPIAERLRREGRLRGNYRRFSYGMRPEVEVLYRLLKSCQGAAMAARRVAQVMGPARGPDVRPPRCRLPDGPA